MPPGLPDDPACAGRAAWLPVSPATDWVCMYFAPSGRSGSYQAGILPYADQSPCCSCCCLPCCDLCLISCQNSPPCMTDARMHRTCCGRRTGGLVGLAAGAAEPIAALDAAAAPARARGGRVAGCRCPCSALVLADDCASNSSGNWNKASPSCCSPCWPVFLPSWLIRRCAGSSAWAQLFRLESSAAGRLSVSASAPQRALRRPDRLVLATAGRLGDRLRVVVPSDRCELTGHSLSYLWWVARQVVFLKD